MTSIASIAATMAIASAATTLLTVLVGIPFTPARYWQWRLRKHREVMDAIGEEAHPNQYAALTPRATFLANKVAAYHRVPTGTATKFITWLVLIAFVNVIISLIYLVPYILAAPILWATVFTLIVVQILVSFIHSVHRVTVRLLHEYRERKRFVNEGCDREFVLREYPTIRKYDPFLLFIDAYENAVDRIIDHVFRSKPGRRR